MFIQRHQSLKNSGHNCPAKEQKSAEIYSLPWSYKSNCASAQVYKLQEVYPCQVLYSITTHGLVSANKLDLHYLKQLQIKTLISPPK